MNKLISTLVVIILSTVLSHASDGLHYFFLSGNRNIQVENSVYLLLKSPDYEAWSSPYNKSLWSIGYSYGLNTFLNIGCQFEKETVQFDNYSIGKNATANRFAAGLHIEANYPKKPFHITCGSFVNFGKAKSKEFDFNLDGFEYGLYLGPEYSIQKINISFLVKPKFSYYTSGGKDAESLLLLYPAIMLRLKYAF